MNYHKSIIVLTLFSFSSIAVAEPSINVPKISVEENKELPFGDTSLDLDLIATKKNLNASAENGSLLSTIGFVVMKADDHNKINMNGYILIILGFIKILCLHLILKFS